MRSVAVCGFLLFALPLSAPGQQTSSAIKSTKATCSSNNTGSNSHITINCTGIGKEQGDEIIKLINKALARQDPTEALERLNEKADEILSAVNPNKSVTTYDCFGTRRTVGPSAEALVATDIGGPEENEANRQNLTRLLQSGDWNGLLQAANAVTNAEPKWFTPQLYAALATERLGRKDEARKLLNRFDSLAGGAYEQRPCSALKEQLLIELNRP